MQNSSGHTVHEQNWMLLYSYMFEPFSILQAYIFKVFFCLIIFSSTVMGFTDIRLILSFLSDRTNVPFFLNFLYYSSYNVPDKLLDSRLKHYFQFKEELWEEAIHNLTSLNICSNTLIQIILPAIFFYLFKKKIVPLFFITPRLFIAVDLLLYLCTVVYR